MTALEYLASHQLPEASRQLLPEKSFQELRTEIETLLDGNTRITDEIKQAMKARLIGMNRRSLVQNIRACSSFGTSAMSIFPTKRYDDW
jgi:hypothetical protein